MIKRNIKGQALIETALVLILLLIIFLGIAEFSRAWYTKNSLKNAVRSGARLAVVTPAATATVCPDPLVSCALRPSLVSCPGTGIVNAVCTSPGVPPGSSPTETKVDVCFTNKPSDPVATLDPGDTINVCAVTTFSFTIGGSPWPWPKSTVIMTDASMRYE